MATEHAALVAAERDNQRLKGKLDRVLKDGKNALRQGVNSALTVGSAFGLSYLENRYPERAELAGMRLSLVVGGLALTAGALGWTGEDELALAVGNGALSANAAQRGATMGAEHRAKAAQTK
jgi:hypothetical protein